MQNFRAKPDTRMRDAPEPDLNELLWTVAVARRAEAAATVTATAAAAAATAGCCSGVP